MCNSIPSELYVINFNKMPTFKPSYRDQVLGCNKDIIMISKPLKKCYFLQRFKTFKKINLKFSIKWIKSP